MLAKLERSRVARCAGALFATSFATMNRVSTFRRVLYWLSVTLLTTPVLAQVDESVQSLDAIRATAQTFVTKHVPKQDAASVTVNVGTLDPRLRLAPCPEQLKAALPSSATFRDRMTIAVSCAGATNWTVYVPVSIETQTQILVLRRAVARGARLTADDVEVQTRLVQGTSDSYLTDAAELAGYTIKRPLGAGAALTPDVLMPDLVVKRGQQVTLLASVGGLQVRAVGQVMNDAPMGGRAKVQNISSGRIVEGVVETADVIRISP